MSIEWTPPPISVNIVGYRIYQGAVLLATVSKDTAQFSVGGLAPGEKYTFRVEAGDASGGWSTTGPSVTVITQPASSLFPSLSQYWYLPVGGITAIIALALMLRRTSSRKMEGELEANPPNETREA